ncbi:MAG: hypothetical protein ABDI19_06980 [Armatimonadota bacterium]
MPTLQIQLDAQEWEPLKELAARLGCTEADVARRLLRQVLMRVSPPSAEWQQRWDALLQQVHQYTARIPPEEVEADITAAFEEYRRECGS